ncbi:unnamed protein product [Gongylonema pulchrum]|uniref:DUF4102 domain-containing protein n=1 Tax=Gongylonema pulchrum TaxID=637853 RepID=A0A183EBC7_9BILA|nr:unnamed protein product [Gongylonema pulchrum]
MNATAVTYPTICLLRASQDACAKRFVLYDRRERLGKFALNPGAPSMDNITKQYLAHDAAVAGRTKHKQWRKELNCSSKRMPSDAE